MTLNSFLKIKIVVYPSVVCFKDPMIISDALNSLVFCTLFLVPLSLHFPLELFSILA